MVSVFSLCPDRIQEHERLFQNVSELHHLVLATNGQQQIVHILPKNSKAPSGLQLIS